MKKAISLFLIAALLVGAGGCARAASPWGAVEGLEGETWHRDEVAVLSDGTYYFYADGDSIVQFDPERREGRILYAAEDGEPLVSIGLNGKNLLFLQGMDILSIGKNGGEARVTGSLDPGEGFLSNGTKDRIVSGQIEAGVIFLYTRTHGYAFDPQTGETSYLGFGDRFEPEGGSLYFIPHNYSHIERADPKSGEVAWVAGYRFDKYDQTDNGAPHALELAFLDGELYYRNKQAVYRYVDGIHDEQIMDDPGNANIYGFIAADGGLYYEKKNKGVYFLDVQTGEETALPGLAIGDALRIRMEDGTYGVLFLVDGAYQPAYIS